MSAHGAAPQPLVTCVLEANGWKVSPTVASLAVERGCRFVRPAPPRGVQGALAALESQQGETCACGCRPVPGKLVILDMEIVKAKWEARLSSFHAGTWGAFLLLSRTRARREEWDQDEALCMEFSPGDSGDFNQGAISPDNRR